MQAFSEEVEPLRVAQRKLVRMLGLLDRHCIVDLTLAQGHTLVEIGTAGEATVSELSAILGVDLSVASRAAASLVRLGLVSATVGSVDRRERVLRLTRKGQERLDELNVRASSQAGDALALLTEDQRRQILEGVQLYGRALDKARRLRGVSIRPSTQADNAGISSVIREVMTEYGAVGEGYSIQDPEVKAMHEAYDKPGHVLLVVERDGSVVGTACIAPLIDGEEDTCELRKMYFLPQMRGLGLGRRMLEELLDRARGLGYRRCYLESLSHMQEARRLYDSMGFVMLDSPMGCTGHGKCNVWMVRDL